MRSRRGSARPLRTRPSTSRRTVRGSATARLLDRAPHDAADWAAAGALAAARVHPDDDIHASAAYRRHLAGVLTARAARAAAARAAAGPESGEVDQ